LPASAPQFVYHADYPHSSSRGSAYRREWPVGCSHIGTFWYLLFPRAFSVENCAR
uniref:Uncharacterized protein n=1 Tax=Rodentolepis nana TaxID=102285 RepID=A0A0R3TIC3_RODNA